MGSAGLPTCDGARRRLFRADAAERAAAAAGKSLRLDLPPLPGRQPRREHTPTSLRAFAALYLQAELEDARHGARG